MRIDLPCCGFKNCRHCFDGNCTKPSEQGKCEYWYLLHKDLYGTQSHWVSCSERLPDDSDYRECMECIDGAVWYFTKNGAMGLGYYYKSTKEWSTIDDLRTDGKVVAWMPLPSPYQPEEECL